MIRRQRRFSRGSSIPASLVALALVPLLFILLPAGVASASTTTTTTISVPGTSTYFASASLSVTVTASGGNPTSGTVTISDSFGDFSCNDTLSGSNVASCSTGYNQVGTDTITATYSGSGSFAGSVGYASVVVGKASVSLSASASAATVGQTTTVTVLASPSIAGNSSGAVTISDSGYANELSCSTTFSNSQASCQSSAYSNIGSDNFSVNWAGNADYNAASTSTSLSVTQATTTVESVTAPTTQVGETTTITALVVPHPDGGDVSFADTDHQVSGCTSQPVNTSTGIATCTTPVLTTADPSDGISASYLGDTNYAASSQSGTGTLDVERGSTQITVSANPSPSVGSSATYTAGISPSTAVAGGGTVSFSDTASKITDCNSISVNSPSCESLTYSQVGNDQVSASFSGNTNWAPASGETTFAVAQGQPDVSVSLLPANPTVGEQVTISATVAPTDGGGSVAFTGSYISGCSAQTLSSGIARCTTAALAATGSWTVTASYSGDANYESAGAFKTVTVTAAPTTVTVGATNQSPVAFSADTITATVSPIPDGGTVAFTDTNGTISGCGSVSVNSSGVASCPISALPGAGTYNVTATYGGDSDYLGNNNALALAIARIPTTVFVTPATNPVTVGQSTTITITVSPVPDSGGTVTVTDQLNDVSCTNVSIPTTGPSAGTATCSALDLSPAGTDALSSSFSGTTNYLPTTGSGSITINRLTSTTVISSADSYGMIGGTLHISATVSPVPSNGVVSFTDSLGELGACATVAVNSTTGVASCTSATLSVTGSDVISVTFAQTAIEASSSTGTTIPIEADAAIAGSLSFTETAGSPATGTIDATGYPAPTVTAGASLPSGMTLSSGGVLSGSPAFGSGGQYSIPISATNSLNTATATATIVVDQVPSVSSATNLSAAYGALSTFTVTSAVGTYPTASFALSGALPSGMTFIDNRNGTGTISGVPSNYVSGTQSFSLLVFNSVGSVNVPFTINVTGTPTQPTSSTTPPSSTTPTTSSTSGNSSGLSSLSQALALHRSEAVASAGRQPKVTVRGSLPTTWDPIARTKTIKTDGKVTKVPVVTLGSDARFPVLGNVGPYGDCAVVADSNIVRVDHLLGKVKSVPAMTTKQALDAWNAINGGDGEGLTDAQFLNAWSSAAGLLGTRITGWRNLSTTNIKALKEAIEADGALYAGIVLPSAGVVGNTIDPVLTASSQVSGHGLTLFGWTGKGFLGVSWGEVVLIPYNWWSKYSTTSYAPNTPQVLAVGKKS